MFGIGAVEVIILIVIAVLAFGAPAIIGYFIGYSAGQKRAAESGRAEESTTPSKEIPHE